MIDIHGGIMNSKAPAPGSRDALDASNTRVDARQNREENASSSILTGPQSRRSGAESHAALAGDLHNMLGNSVVHAALSGMDTGPGAVVEDALTLGAAGMQVADTVAGLFSNRFMQGQLAANAPAPSVAIAASALSRDSLSRRGGAEEFSDEAGKKVDVALKRGGKAMPDDLRAKMEQAFGGADFSRVRIHTDGAATAAAHGIRAHAFAVGEHVYFGTGEFRPHSREGQELLAHELTHVVQHQEGRIRASESSGGTAGDMAVSSPTDSHEREAEAMATQVVGALGSVDTDASVSAATMEAGASVEAGTDSGAAGDPAMASRFLKGGLAGAMQVAQGMGSAAGAMDKLGIPGGDVLGRVSEVAQSGMELKDQLLNATKELESLEGALRNLADIGDSIGAKELEKLSEQLKKLAGGVDALQKLQELRDHVSGGGGSAEEAEEGGEDAGSKLEQIFSQAQESFGAVEDFAGKLESLTSGELGLDQLKALVGTPDGIKKLLGQLGDWKKLLGGQEELIEEAMGAATQPVQSLLSGAGFSLKQESGAHTVGRTPVSMPGSSGHALPAQTKAALRSQLGPAVDKVRIHTGPEAAKFANDLNARAVTVGQDIYFNKGEFRPGTTDGDQLLGHEMHHAVVGGGGPGVSRPGEAHERAADAFGDQFVQVGGTQALTRMGLEAPTEALSSQINDRLAAVPRGGLDAVSVDPELATAGIAPVSADLSVATSLPAPSFDVPSIDVGAEFTSSFAAPDISVESISTPMGNAESFSRDLMAGASQAFHGSARGASDTTSGTSETQADTHAELTIAGKVYRVRVPPSEGQTATANTDLDARPVEGLHLTGATVNIDAEGVISGGTVRGQLEVPGFLEGTEVALGILPGGTIAPAIENLPIKVGPATGTANLSITEAGLEGSGTVAAAELGLPEWVGLRGGDLEIALSAGEVTGNGSLTGTTTAIGTAALEIALADQTLTSEVTYTLVPNYSPVRGVVVHNGVLSGTLVTPLGQSEEGGGDAAGPVADNAVAAAGGDTQAAAQAASPSGDAGGDGGGAQQAMQTGLQNAVGGGEGGAEQGGQQGAEQGSGMATEGGGAASGGGEGGGGGRDPNAFLLTGTGQVTVADWVTGDVQIALDPVGRTYDLTGRLAAAHEMQFGELLAVSAEVALEVQQNVPIQATADVQFTGPKYEGEINGEFDIQERKLDGTAVARLTHNWPIEGEWGQIRLLRGGRLDATVEDNTLKDVTGRVRFDGEINGGAEGPLAFEGTLEGQFDGENEQVSGTATGATTGDFSFAATEGGDSLTLLSGSNVRAEVAENALNTVMMGASLRYNRAGAEFLLGEVPDATYDVAAGTLSGKGTFTLLQDLERSTTDGKWTVRILKNTNVEATLDASKLTEIGGDITVQVDDDQGKLAQGQLTGAKIEVETWETSGKLKLTTARKFFYPGEGQLMANGYNLAVMTGSGINATMRKDELTEVGGDLRIMVSDAEGALARLRLQATMDLTNDEVDGEGTIALARQLVVAENLAGQGWTAKVKRGTKATGHIEASEFTKITGEIKGAIDDQEGEFLEVNGTGQWTTADDLYSVNGQITVQKEKELGNNGEWSLTLLPEESQANASIVDDVFQSISGTVSTMVRKAGEDFAKVSLGGSWTESDGFAGEGEAELLTDVDVATVGDYNLWVVKGTGARIAVAQNDVDEIGGQVPMRLDDQGQEFIKGNVGGTYAIEEKKLNGSGSAEVLVEKHLGTLGNDQLWLIPSTSATVTVADNALTEVGGEMNLSVRNGEGEYAQIALQGSFDAQGGTGFTGTGGVTVTRNNKLFEAEGYSFWLKEGAGATAHIEQNKLTKIDGNVPFMVKDGGEAALIEGSVNGTYDPVSGNISGTGAVYLGRTVEYNLGGGVQLKLLEGSGGDADVNESKLERLGGTLNAEVWKDGQGVVRVTADGEYNVLTNTLTRLSGTATLLRPLQLLGGAVEVSNVVGTATIENNELVEAGGRGDLIIHPLNDMQGWFEVNWSTRGGVETYDGTGNVEFTLMDRDPQTGRGMGGEIGVSMNSNGEFTAAGEIDYDINQAIGGKLQVRVDQNWDPEVYGLMEVDTNLVEARDLFSLERDIIPETSQPLPYGLALFYGMRGGMSMGLDALHLEADIAVGNWHPLTEGSVPTFQSSFDLTWGMNFKAMVAPFLGIGGDIGFAYAQMGIRGEVELNAPVQAHAGGELKGQGGGFYGELEVGVRIAPTIDLAIIPYISGGIPDLLEFQQDLDRFEQPLGTIFEFEWGRKYGFGDTEYKNQAPVQPMDIPAPSHKNTQREGRVTNLGIGNGGGGGSQVAGGPQLESGSQVAAEQEVGDGEMSNVMDTLNDIIAVVEGLGAAGELFGMLTSALAALATFGPAGLIVHIVWGIFKGDLSWDRIKTAVTKVVEAIQAAGRLLRNHFPGWWNSIVDTFNGERPGLLDALFGADDRMREAVGRGDHRHAPYDMHLEMVQTMKGGWLSTDDANCIAQVFEVAAQRGWLHRLVNACGGGDEFIDGWSTGFDDRAIKRVFDRNGIRY